MGLYYRLDGEYEHEYKVGDKVKCNDYPDEDLVVGDDWSELYRWGCSTKTHIVTTSGRVLSVDRIERR